ncbi:MAG: hypothetical protein LBQ12_01490 [Deltaproteobacteria bacterium]|jgi:hypothetical protein|nr:hypothetical protein [Deltaproteobacteria bacterium]
MRLSYVAATVAAAFAFAVLASGHPLQAQWLEDDLSPFAKKAPKLQGAAAVKDEGWFRPDACPSTPFKYSIIYPRGFDNGGAVDRAVAARVAPIRAQAKGLGEGFTGFLGDCKGPDGYFTLRSSPYRVSGSAYSVIMSYQYYSGGTHPNDGFAALNLFSDGTEITLDSLFPNKSRSLPLLRDRILKSILARGAEGLGPNTRSLDDAGHMLLTTLGLSVHQGSGEAGSYAEGPMYLDIPKEDLLGMGANPDIWR